MGGYPGDVEQQCSAVEVGDLGDDLTRIIQSLVVVDTLTDDLDKPAGEGYGVEEAGVAEVYSREGGRLLRMRTRGEKCHERQRAHSEGKGAARDQTKRPGEFTRSMGFTYQ